MADRLRTDDRVRFFFVHVHKSAGTSVWKRLSVHFAETARFPNAGDGDPHVRTLSVEHALAAWPARRDEVDVVAGHFPLCTQELLGGRFRCFTLLREPVERVLSALRHQRQSLPELATASYADIYDVPLRQLLMRNHMVKMFGLRAHEMDEGALTDVAFTPELLDRALIGLDDVEVVGFQDDVEDFCARLEASYGWELGDPLRMNASRPDEVPPELIERIRDDNALDIEFYAEAQRRFGNG